TIQLWRNARERAVLMLVWTWVPPLVLLAGSLVFFPMLVTRYVISSFVPVSILAAVGIRSLGSANVRAFALALLLVLSLVTAAREFRPGDERWRDACKLALARQGPGRRVGACHDYELVRYYLGRVERAKVEVVPVKTGAEPTRVVIVSPTVGPAQAAQL